MTTLQPTELTKPTEDLIVFEMTQRLRDYLAAIWERMRNDRDPEVLHRFEAAADAYGGFMNHLVERYGRERTDRWHKVARDRLSDGDGRLKL